MRLVHAAAGPAPLLRTLVARPGVRRVVLHLDPAMEPEPWLAAATGDEPLGLTPDDDRTLAQVAVGQVEFADAVVVTGQAEGWTRHEGRNPLGEAGPL